MADDEQFSLCWNNFNTNLSAGFHESLCRGDLVDVTLAAEGQLVKAHRLVLSVCSPYFRKMFTQMPANQHAFVFLKDVSHSALKDLIQFMYCGEVNVKQDALPAFISTAEALQIKGLTETGETSAPQQSPAKESTIVPNVPSSASPRSKPQRNRIQSYKVESEESSDEKIVAHNVQVQSQKRTVQRSVTPQSMPVLKRAKITSDPLESPESTIQTVHIVKQQVQSTEPEYVELPIETINPKSEPEYVEDTSEIEAGDQEQEQEQEAHEIQEQDDAHNYVEDESYGDIKYDESYFTENDEVKAGVSGFSESYVEGDQSASEAQESSSDGKVLELRKKQMANSEIFTTKKDGFVDDKNEEEPTPCIKQERPSIVFHNPFHIKTQDNVPVLIENIIKQLSNGHALLLLKRTRVKGFCVQCIKKIQDPQYKKKMDKIISYCPACPGGHWICEKCFDETHNVA